MKINCVLYVMSNTLMIERPETLEWHHFLHSQLRNKTLCTNLNNFFKGNHTWNTLEVGTRAEDIMKIELLFIYFSAHLSQRGGRTDESARLKGKRAIYCPWSLNSMFPHSWKTNDFRAPLHKSRIPSSKISNQAALNQSTTHDSRLIRLLKYTSRIILPILLLCHQLMDKLIQDN